MATKLLDLEPQRREAILNAALKEFALKGFDLNTLMNLEKYF